MAVRRRRGRRRAWEIVRRPEVAAGAFAGLATIAGGAARLPKGFRPPGAVELPGARRRREVAERRTQGLGLVAIGMTVVVLGSEFARVWRRGSAPLPTETVHVLGAAEEAVRETVSVARAGYQEAPVPETALLNMLLAFALTFGIVRASTHTIRARGTFGPFRNLRFNGSHIHHFVPGIVLAFASGGAAVLARAEWLDPWLALPFGVGVALTLDESALLLKLDDVYWSEEGIVSVQITMAALASLSATALGVRVLRRGEQRVLDPGS
jgi:hypothetical protein